MTSANHATVNLYEDNAGTLRLVRGYRVAILPQAHAGTFAEDAADFAATGGADWEGVEIIEAGRIDPTDETIALVASWIDGEITIYGDDLVISRQPGSHARRYLGYIEERIANR